MATDQLAHESSGRSRGLLAAFFIAAGVNHFAMPRAYEAIVPPRLRGQAGPVVQLSGVAEILGGLAVLLPWTRRLSGPYLVALLAAVFPANLYMARTPERFGFPRWALFARLPLQPLMMLWRGKRRDRDSRLSSAGPPRCYVRLAGLAQFGPPWQPRPP